MSTGKTVRIDSLPESALRYRNGYAVVAVDVIRATTTAITAAAMSRRCYPVDSLEAAFELASYLDAPLLAGEIDGEMPPGFDMNNSPAKLAERTDISRPLVLLSSSGTRLMVHTGACDHSYLACFRNPSAMARRLIKEGHTRVALIGAGSRGQFREEDQICCAWVAARLVSAGYDPGNKATIEILNRWGNAEVSDCLVSQSIDYLTKTGQLADLHFILGTIDDLDETFLLQNGEIVMAPREVLSSEPDRVVA